jgi:hypothetical protein
MTLQATSIVVDVFEVVQSFYSHPFLQEEAAA